MRKRTFYVVLAALALVRLVLMAVAPVFEPSEARYAAISANMARSGDFVVPHFTHNGRYQSFDGKPPLVFQAGGLALKAFGVDSPVRMQFAVRVFPFLSAVLMLAILHWSLTRSTADVARLAVVICATSTAFYAASGISMTDMTLTCAVAGALLCYRLILEGGGAIGVRILPWVGVAALLGVGMITKGPVALALFGFPVLLDAIVNRHWKFVFNWRWLVVAPVFLLIAVPWFVLVEQRNPGSVWYFFYNENFMRFVSHDYGDKYGAGREAFRGVSVLWAIVATLPWVLVPMWDAVKRWKDAGLKGLKDGVTTVGKSFEVLAIVAIVGFWCLTSRVLLYYLFPIIPLFAVALALKGPRERLVRLAVPCAALTGGVLVVLLTGGALFSEKMRGAKTPYCPYWQNYAHEFYHGPQNPGEAK